MPLQLTELGFKAAPSGTSTTPSTVTVLVGPNNSGKSVALREIEQWAAGEHRDRAVIDQIDVEWPQTRDEALALLEPFETEPGEGEAPQPDSMLIAPFRPDGTQRRMWISRPHVEATLALG